MEPRLATIEPRLIHLLNESKSPQQPHNDLPPIYSLPNLGSADRSLPPLEPDASRRLGFEDWPAPTSVTAPGSSGFEDGYTTQPRRDGSSDDGSYAGTTAVQPMRLLLGEPDSSESAYPLSKILDDTVDLGDDASSKKRNRALTTKDDVPQLPQPVKKQKATPDASFMPPIINGLHEPPPHAALFPPIASYTSYEDNDSGPFRLLQEFNYAPEERASGQTTPPEPETGSSKSRKRATKPRRKWSEAETNALLLGVSKHGVGKWTRILEDADFESKFNGRTAGDLKDRFRTCCPAELQRSKDLDGSASPSSKSHNSKQKDRDSTKWANICIEDEDEHSNDTAAASPESTNAGQRQKKSRAHRKNMEDLENLGIYTPFKKSRRRERRPFTEQDDNEILLGLEKYGPAWTKIQRDLAFNLSSRQPTDLRDRMRNKYPDVYQSIEKGTFRVKNGAKANDIMEPSLNTSSQYPSLKPQLSQATSKEELGRLPIHDAGGDSGPPQFLNGEMDISRLLLDDRAI